MSEIKRSRRRAELTRLDGAGQLTDVTVVAMYVGRDGRLVVQWPVHGARPCRLDRRPPPQQHGMRSTDAPMNVLSVGQT